MLAFGRVAEREEAHQFLFAQLYDEDAEEESLLEEGSSTFVEDLEKLCDDYNRVVDRDLGIALDWIKENWELLLW